MTGGLGGPAQRPAGEQESVSARGPAPSLPQGTAAQTVQDVERKQSPAGSGLVRRHDNSAAGLLGWGSMPPGIMSPRGASGGSVWRRVTPRIH